MAVESPSRVARDAAFVTRMRALRDFTSARVDLGIAGDSLPLKALLDFRVAHARARDTVHFPLDSNSMLQECAQRGWPARIIHSTANDRSEYLQRPDKGRVLDSISAAEVAAVDSGPSLLFVIADGLSALAIHRHALPLLEIVFRHLKFEPAETNPVWIATEARVAIADHVGGLLDASLSVLLIGERPGLSAPDSLGIYLTWQPKRGRTDAERNCISNVHSGGLSHEEAAHRLLFLIEESRRRQISGVTLKETAGPPLLGASDTL